MTNSQCASPMRGSMSSGRPFMPESAPLAHMRFRSTNRDIRGFAIDSSKFSAPRTVRSRCLLWPSAPRGAKCPDFPLPGTPIS